MQSLTAAPRDAFTTTQITDLLQANNLTVDFGAELLAADLSLTEDISTDVVGGSISRNMHATIHGTCRLVLSRSLTWGVDLVKPYMTLSDGNIEARWNLGVYALTTPDRRIGETPETYDVQGYDRLMLLNRQVGASYTVTSGTTYRAAVLAVFTAAGLSGVSIEGSAADDSLPADKTWALVADDQADPDQTATPATYLRIVNDLLRAINFRSVWVDQDGQFICQAYQDPAARGVEFTFDADDEHLTVVGEDRTLTEDIWAVPNKWVFRRTNGGAGIEGDGIYTVDQSDVTDGDWLGRKLEWVSVVDYEAASQAKLVDLGDRRVAIDKAITSTLIVRTGPFPGAGHADVFRYRDSAIGDRKVQATEWSFDLAGGDVEWRWEKV